MTRSFRVLANQKAQITCKFEVICEVIQGRKKQVKVGGLWLSGALFHKKRAPSSKFIYGGYTMQLFLKLLNSECL